MLSFSWKDPDFPQCGSLLMLLEYLIILESSFLAFNVLEDNESERVLKVFRWPTIPQIYIKKEFVGGLWYFKRNGGNREMIKLLEKNNLPYKLQIKNNNYSLDFIEATNG